MGRSSSIQTTTPHVVDKGTTAASREAREEVFKDIAPFEYGSCSSSSRTLTTTASSAPSTSKPETDGPAWYQTCTFYEVFVRSFCDSNGDGIGDLQGLISKLDYIRHLGVDAIWLLPIWPSPLRDHGYDVSNYEGIHPDYGTLEDFDDLIACAHARDLKIVVELVPNHTSTDHPWFQASRDSQHPDHQKYKDWYMWSDDDSKFGQARVIFCDSEPSNWAWDDVRQQYYFHRFKSCQPDLNYDNEEVQVAVLHAVSFWAKRGVDGIRVDAPPYLFKREGSNCENLPETHVFLKRLRSHLDELCDALNRPRLMLLSEANQPAKEVVEYFGNGSDEFDMSFNFPVMPRIFSALARKDAGPIKEVVKQIPALPSSKSQWGTFLRNHDELTLEMVSEAERQFMWNHYASEDPRHRLNLGIRRRLAPLLGNNLQAIKLAHSILLSIIGSPFLYYGDEIGMGDDVTLPDRDGCRTPMPWDEEGNYKPVTPRFGRNAPMLDEVSVSNQIQDPDSLLSWIRSALEIRRSVGAVLGAGSLTMIEEDETLPPQVLAYARQLPGHPTVLVFNNLGTQNLTLEMTPEWLQAQGITLKPQSGQSEMRVVDLFSGLSVATLPANTPADAPDDTPIRIRLPANGFQWLKISS